MRTRQLLIVIALTLLSALHAAAQQVYRCQEAGGQPSFQQQPCAHGKGVRFEVPPTNTVEGNPEGEQQLRYEAARASAARSALARGRLMRGMTEGEMRQVLGVPTVVNTDSYGDSTRQQFVYRYPDGSARYVYAADGVVQSLQERPAVLPVHSDHCRGARGEELRKCRR